jgi:hypothetical protein
VRRTDAEDYDYVEPPPPPPVRPRQPPPQVRGAPPPRGAPPQQPGSRRAGGPPPPPPPVKQQGMIFFTSIWEEFPDQGLDFEQCVNRFFFGFIFCRSVFQAVFWNFILIQIFLPDENMFKVFCLKTKKCPEKKAFDIYLFYVRYVSAVPQLLEIFATYRKNLSGKICFVFSRVVCKTNS